MKAIKKKLCLLATNYSSKGKGEKDKAQSEWNARKHC